MVDNRHPERLYLAKGENKDIYVDTIGLPLHQYEGIRFLYRQFKKGKAGVILNDPSGYGKRVQTVLFLSAMHPVMTLPILILCTDGKEQIWTHRFNKWTNMGPDVTVQKSHEVIKPVCVISTFYYISMLSRREWGMVVIDDNNVSRDILRSGLNTKYKIWLTPMDMKKNLQTFSLIHKWFYPKDRFVVEDFQATKKTPSALLEKSVKLDAFMEDIVIRRKDVTLPLGKANQNLNTARVSRKNKDATGKKIKRSKALPEYEEYSEPQEKVAVRMFNNGENENYSIDDFEVSITDKEQAKMDVVFTLPDVTSNYNNEIEEDCINKLEDNDEEQENSEVMEIEFSDDNYAQKRRLVIDCDTKVDSNKLLNSEDKLSQNITIKYDSDTPDIDDDDDIVPAKTIKYTHDINSKDNQFESKDLFSTDTLQSECESKMQNHDIIFVSNIANAKTNETDSKNKKIHSEDIFSADLPSNEVKDEIKTDDLNRNKNEVVNNNVSEINKTDLKLDGVELKMKQMEELAMKKFKGSFLDNIF